jgi:hypothetical protein
VPADRRRTIALAFSRCCAGAAERTGKSPQAARKNALARITRLAAYRKNPQPLARCHALSFTPFDGNVHLRVYRWTCGLKIANYAYLKTGVIPQLVP